jgi:sodium-independent sulfate anion transporter 11
LRNQFDRYADPDRVEWHFTGITNRWTKRALVASGFGADRRGHASDEKSAYGPLIAVAEANGTAIEGKAAVVRTKAKEVDVEAGGEVTPVATSGGTRLVPLYGVNRPYFHVDVETAVASTIANLEGRGSLSA